ncbi:MAG: hypothetical protein AAF922_09480 [Pseudomonadota bacterium]
MVGEFDRLALANYEASMTAQAEWEMRVAEYQARNPGCVNPELELDCLDQIADEKAREEHGNEHDNLGLEL